MNIDFLAHAEALHAKCDALLSMNPVKGKLPATIRGAGVYLFSENGAHLYVGRTRDVKRRYAQHLRLLENQAPFAFLLAREVTGLTASKNKGGVMTRKELTSYSPFLTAFKAMSQRVAAMDFRFVEESDAIRQCLLEVYVAVATNAPYNDFTTS